MKYTLKITDIKPILGFETWEGNWSAADSNGDDIIELAWAAIPYAIQSAGLHEDHNEIVNIETFTKEGHAITSECTEGTFIAST